jgi:hypothetical protein
MAAVLKLDEYLESQRAVAAKMRELLAEKAARADRMRAAEPESMQELAARVISVRKLST